MADDTRQSDDPKTNELQEQLDARRDAVRKPKPKHDFPQTQAGKLWDAFHDPNNPVNQMPGGTYNTAGGKPKEVTWRDAFDFDKLSPKMPWFFQTSCGRDSLLVGMGAAGSVGGVGLVLRGLQSVLLTSNLAVGAFTVTASGMYYWCDSRRREEGRGMAMAVQGMKMLNEKKNREKAEAEAAAAARQAEEEKKRARSWSNKLKVW